VTRVGLAVHRTFHAIGHSRNFRLFFIGQGVSVTGTWMQSVASAWLVLQITHSGVALGIQAALNFGPILLLGAWGGALADRGDKHRILLGTQAAFGILALAMWAVVQTDVVRLWMVYGLSLLQGVVTAVDNPTRQSFFAEMVDERDLTNAVSLNSAIMTGTRIVGPALAGLLIATAGMAPVFLVNAISYLAVIAGLLVMRRDELRRTPRAAEGRVIREGFRYAWETPALRVPIVLMAVVFLFSFNFSVLLPLLAERDLHGDAGTLGSLLAVMGVGSLIGALAVAGRVRPTPERLSWASIGLGLATLLVASAPSLSPVLVALIPLGFVGVVFMITGNSALQLTARPDMRGRVMAIYAIVFLGGTPVGAPISGWIAEIFGARIGLSFGAVIAIVAGVAALRTLAGKRRRPEPAAGAVPSGLSGVPADASVS
jgi:MFS family permease